MDLLDWRSLEAKGAESTPCIKLCIAFHFISLLVSFQDVSLRASVVHRICHCSVRMKDVSKGHWLSRTQGHFNPSAEA